MMRVGISIGTTFSTGGPGGHREGPRSVLSQAQAANRAGLDTLTVGDRKAVAYGDPDHVAEQLSAFQELGFTDVIIRTMSPLPPEIGSRRGLTLRRASRRGARQARLARPGLRRGGSSWRAYPARALHDEIHIHHVHGRGARGEGHDILTRRDIR
jgi:hypothetical protein